MLTIAYMSNLFPASVEPYVMYEIAGLRRLGAAVVPCSARRPHAIDLTLDSSAAGTVYIQPMQLAVTIRALWLCIKKLPALAAIVAAALFREHESLGRRMKAIVHTFLGAYLAVRLEPTSVDHIHAHHGYSGCWIAMVAARLRGISYSVTLHGSDLLLHKAFLNTKLANCRFCVTVSEYNRQHILENYRAVDPMKIFVRGVGVEPQPSPARNPPQAPLIILSVGRLHRVKNHAFLIEACAELKRHCRPFACLIAGEGPERPHLELLIRKHDLDHEVTLLSHLSPSRLDAFYANSNLVVLTSRSEGLPLVLMEAMARGKIVLAPAITAIPELVSDGETGFLYRQESLESFVEAVERICRASPECLDRIRLSARHLIAEQYDRETNLAAFTTLLLEQVSPVSEINPHENFVLQQI